jgi:hypothetical protein
MVNISWQLIADSLLWFAVRGWRFEAEKQKVQTHTPEIAETSGLQPLTSNLKPSMAMSF